MSSESIRAFFKKMSEDETLAREASGLKTENELISLAGKAGFEFSTQDIKQLREEKINSELENISGGAIGADVPDDMLSVITALRGGNPDDILE